VRVWDTLAIGEYLNEIKPEAGLLPADRATRAHCRAICGEMHSGFSALRSSFHEHQGPFPEIQALVGAQADVDRIVAIWTECLQTYGTVLFGSRPCVADAMFAPVVTRFISYGVALDPACAEYCRTIMALPAMQEWVAGAERNRTNRGARSGVLNQDEKPHRSGAVRSRCLNCGHFRGARLH